MPEEDVANNAPEAGVVRDLAVASVAPVKLEEYGIFYAVVPAGAEGRVTDLEHHLAAPRRKLGTTYLHDADSFVNLTQMHQSTSTLVYADKDGWAVTAVFNAGADDKPGWGDHRATLALRTSREWRRWSANDNKLVTQELFAQHIEDGLEEIVEPAAAEMLELAQTFHAKSGVTFQSSHILASGQRQFSYVEDTQARAGVQGSLTVPELFTLGICPFEGITEGDNTKVAYKLTARFRFRISSGQLQLGYRLVRPDDVIEDAFTGVVDSLQSRIDVQVLRGTVPERP